jgi:PAS domain S-box-containing protein
MLDLLISMSKNALLIFDEAGRVMRANEAAAEMFGWTVAELQKKRIASLLPSPKVRSHAKLFKQFLESGESSRTMGKFRSIVGRRKSGEEFPVEASIGRGELGGKLAAVASLRDLSEEKQAEQLTRLLALISQENPNPVIRVDLAGKIIFANISAEKMLSEIGADNNQYIPAAWMEYIRIAIRQRSQVVQIMNHGDRVYSCAFAPVHQMDYVNIYALDVTEREAEKSRLEISDNILNSIGNLVLVADKNAEIVYVSSSVKNIIGYEREEILGGGWWEMERISGGDVEVEKDYVRKAAAGVLEPDGKPYEHRVRHKDGSWRWLMLSDTKGPRDLLIGIGSDITSIKFAEEELERQRDFAQTLTRQMGQGLTVTDENGSFEYVNPSYAHMLDYSPADLIGKTPFDITFSEDHMELLQAQATRAKGEVTTYESRLRRRDGRAVYALITGVPRILNGQYKGAITVITDLTDRLGMEGQLRTYAEEIRKTNSQLAEARDRALEASYLKSAFLATMSHEIRTPMNAILGMNEMLLDTGLDGEQREFAETIQSATQSLLAILNDILDYSKIEAGKISIRPAPFKPAALVNEIVNLFHPRAIKKDVSIAVMVTSAIPENLVGDAGRIRQVLSNLVSNAVKFTRSGGSIFVNLSGTQINDESMVVTFSVQDSGVGIPEGTRQKLFEPFTQADSTHTREHGGTGLGLAISKRLVDLMHGEIGFDSIEDTGSTFWFSLPLGMNLSQPDVAAESPEAKTDHQRSDFSGLRPALIVEDNLINRDLLSMQLREFGLSARHAGNGLEALELLEVEPDAYSIVLMDLNMPDMDGITATRFIRRNEEITKRHVLIVAVTANAMMGTREACLNSGMDDFLAKPVSLSDIKALLVKWLN